MMEALEREYVQSGYESPQFREEESPVSPLATRNSRIADSEDGSDNSDPPRGAYSRFPPQHPSISSTWPRHVSTSSESMISGQSDGSGYGRTTPTSPLTSATKRSLSPSLLNQPAPLNMRTEYMFPESRPTTLRQIEDQAGLQKYSPESGGSPLVDLSHTEVVDAVAGAMQQLQQARMKEQSRRPLRFESQDKFHKPDAELHKHFESSAFDELKVRRLSTRDWLLVSVWWLLKVLIISSCLCNCH